MNDRKKSLTFAVIAPSKRIHFGRADINLEAKELKCVFCFVMIFHDYDQVHIYVIRQIGKSVEQLYKKYVKQPVS